ncbi:hypothetical protein D3P09_11855 [Paenibacillus pinisoli]|uniref:Uncharacterized protein n=1 Tax=Paenibacillus pinisoli TaxID=1276110 RepID=A0A3A6PXG2_9BACL|nr:hypothetical protein [Paenibacillus pinisoli]RJX40063.1 hypothetical protein D3P09_11855 [Paenibacillus pinisoli]
MQSRYQKMVYIDAIEFDNTAGNPQAIIEFTGLPISVEYTNEGVQVRVIRGAYSVLNAKLGELIIKEANGLLRVCTRAELEAEYDLVD